MLATTIRYADKKTCEFAQAFSFGLFTARGKKSIEQLVSLARKKGENTLAIVSPKKINFIFISALDWKWKKLSLNILDYKIKNKIKKQKNSKDSICIKGENILELEELFGVDPFYEGEQSIIANKSKMKFLDKDKIILELEYKIKNEEWEK